MPNLLDQSVLHSSTKRAAPGRQPAASPFALRFEYSSNGVQHKHVVTDRIGEREQVFGVDLRNRIIEAMRAEVPVQWEGLAPFMEKAIDCPRLRNSFNRV